MPPRSLRPIISTIRTGLRSAARRSPQARRLFEVAIAELDGALDDGELYGARYYGVGRDGRHRGLSGYDVYDRKTSQADKAAYCVWRYFDVKETLDVGCALGFLVEALRELGFDTQGSDVSEFAVANATRGAKGHVRVGNLLERLPYDDASFDLVSAFETLEHLEPQSVPSAIAELHRITRGWLIATIPSFGPNECGPAGWLDGKVRPERLEHYQSLGSEYDGPVEYDDLFRDVVGEPVEGHLTIASFSWWTRRFEEAGFVRRGDMEARIYEQFDRFGLTGSWNLYVCSRPEMKLPSETLRSEAEIARAEQRLEIA